MDEGLELLLAERAIARVLYKYSEAPTGSTSS